MPEIRKIRIHPAIGIARVGNAEPTADGRRDDYFLGPRIPRLIETPPGGYKLQGRVKRQAAEFRLFGYDEEDRLLGEITAADADIVWTVQLANKKSAWRRFAGLKKDTPWRNSHIQGADRAMLEITPPAQMVRAGDLVPRIFEGKFADRDGGQPIAVPVYLGEAWSTPEGRLIVLGGKGWSSSPFNRRLTDFANNIGWHDDLSDGPVDARVRLKDGADIPVLGSWVICTLPKYAPELPNIVTLYETLHQVAVDEGMLPAPQETEYYRDVQPLIERTLRLKWVLDIRDVHDYLFERSLRADAPLEIRRQILRRLRNPASRGSRGRANMPVLYDDNNSWEFDGKDGFTITATQYGHLKRWANGQCAVGDPLSFPDPTDITPAGMDRAALESCCGGAFYPGMEGGWLLRDVYKYAEPFRLDRVQPAGTDGKLSAGDATKQMAVPWQADFLECTKETLERRSPGWWPQQRPAFVIPYGEVMPVRWERGKVDDFSQMVTRWSELGFVLRDGEGFYERDRTE